MDSINQIISSQIIEDDFLIINESLNIHQQKETSYALCSMKNKWPNSLSQAQFWGKNSQPLDYLLGLIAKGTYWNNWTFMHGVERLNHQQLQELGIEPIHLRDKTTGFESTICRYHDLYIISFAGTNNFTDIFADIRQAVGLYEPQYFQAAALANILYQVSKGNMICTGHSLGGGLAIFAAIVSGCPSITFSPAGIATNTIKRLGIDYEQAKQKAKAGLSRFYVVEYDWLDWLQTFTTAPSALGHKIVLNYYEEGGSAFDKFPPNFFSRVFVAHAMAKILKMMCYFAPWAQADNLAINEINNFMANGINGLMDEIDLAKLDERDLVNWQETCEKCIKQNNVDLFTKLIELENKPVEMDSLIRNAIMANNSQFLAILFESKYAKKIKQKLLSSDGAYLHLAAQSCRTDQIEMLLMHGLTINKLNNEGNTALHEALMSHALFAAEYLLEHGADWRIKNPQGNNGYDVLVNHVITDDILSQEGKVLRKKLFQLMQ
ncbi:ankyrin repeat domain-containing protein [Providencia sneebia]|uniref:Uncharacterized protein n=1 Tax=Providencia sneebia DSM 19967 TaxID=1141660 RepID=K8W5C9_9GAMM|nr:ankyrin repeat domain-containing protein [Providencia sneebia]EKT55793.1 hypothetical protein OO7_12499 [Providencia sneebia DSM 19967]